MRIIVIFLSLIFAVPCHARMLQVIVNSFNSSSPQYLMYETFDATGYDNGPTNWIDGYDGLLDGAITDPDYTTITLSGQALYMSAGGASNQGTWSGGYVDPQSDIWIRFAFYAITWATTDYSDIAAWWDQAVTAGAALLMRTNGQIAIANNPQPGPPVGHSASSSFGSGTWYYVWVHLVRSSGSNDGVMTVYVATTGTMPETPEINVTNAQFEVDIGLVLCTTRAESTSELVYENYGVYTSNPGSF